MKERTKRTPSGRGRKTLKDVSAASGLALITVSRALRRPETVQPETRQRVLDAIDEIGYIPNLTARSLISSRSDMVGVVIPLISSSIFSGYTQSLAAVLHEAGLQMILGVSDRWNQQEEDIVRTFIARQADAIAVIGFTHSERCRALLNNFDGPVAETMNIGRDPIDFAVGFDNYAASADMTRHLIARGYRNIATVGGLFENNDQGADRHRAFLATMAEAGLSVPPEHIIEVPTPTTIASGWEVATKLLNGQNKPDAIYFQAEIPAHGAVMACINQGIGIPDDVAIAGFGDLELSELLPVPLTTLRIKARDIGEATGHLLVRRLQGEDSTERSVDIGYELMIRAST